MDIRKREPMTTIICGMTAVGKTWRSAREIEEYIAGNRNIGREPRKALIFDINGEEEYSKYDILSPDNIQGFVNQGMVEGRRIVRVTEKGKIMDIKEIQETVSKIITKFRGGLFVLEDIDKYYHRAKAQQVTSLLTANRHQDLDVMITHQSMSKITTTEWENATIIRLHYQIDDPKRYENRIPNPELIKLAKYVIDDQYLKAKNERFFVYINNRTQSILPCTENMFILACRRYLQEEPNEMRKILNVIGGDTKKLEDREKGVMHFFEQKKRYIHPK